MREAWVSVSASSSDDSGVVAVPGGCCIVGLSGSGTLHGLGDANSWRVMLTVGVVQWVFLVPAKPPVVELFVELLNNLIVSARFPCRLSPSDPCHVLPPNHLSQFVFLATVLCSPVQVMCRGA